MRSRAGFSLLEVLVATAIMGTAVSMLIVGLSQSARNAGVLTEYDRAAMLARGKMNDLLLDADLPFEGNVDGRFDTQSGGVESGWSAVLKPFEEPPNAGPGTVVLQEVALEIWWQPQAGQRRTMRLSGYRPVRIPIQAAL
jgi:prepilin-type N-terminal cleavage/methylation domain-containing protein